MKGVVGFLVAVDHVTASHLDASGVGRKRLTYETTGRRREAAAGGAAALGDGESRGRVNPTRRSWRFASPHQKGKDNNHLIHNVYS